MGVRFLRPPLRISFSFSQKGVSSLLDRRGQVCPLLHLNWCVLNYLGVHTMSPSLTAMLAVRANTRIALATALIERNAECEALRLKLSEAALTLQQQPTTEQLAADMAQDLHRASNRAINNVAPRAQRSLPAHFAAAREAAMRSGRCVKVSV